MEYVWNNSSCLRLISEYELHPVLWNSDHEMYYVRDKRNEAWNLIAANMDVDVAEVKYKMNNLMGGFRREKYKKTTAYEWGKPRKIFSSKWFAFKAMKFLLKDSDTRDIQYVNDFKNPRSDKSVLSYSSERKSTRLYL